MTSLRFESGTLTLDGILSAGLPFPVNELFKADPRSGNLRARACDYAGTVMALRMSGIDFCDGARAFDPLDDLILADELIPRPHQLEALSAWRRAEYLGVAALPTGSGKTILAVLAMAEIKRPTLVLVPTIDLLAQWAVVLERFFKRKIFMLGGGSHEVGEITVSTYDSAVLNMEFIGNKFGLLVADECHHLPAPDTRMAASMAIAPFRLGLSATPELPDDRAAVLDDLIGPVICRIHIDELEGEVLAPYRVERLMIGLSPEEKSEYDRNRSVYTAFLRRCRINFSYSGAWGRFLLAVAREPGGREAFAAFLEQRRIARAGEGKIGRLLELIVRHRDERVIVFTADNDTAYAIGRRFHWPVITHHTKGAERRDFLDKFRTGLYPVMVTSKVLNEGVDVPAATVGIVVSGSGSVREHVQRLGRILRPAPGKKQAVLYELVSAATSEESISERRRTHRAYRRHG